MRDECYFRALRDSGTPRRKTGLSPGGMSVVRVKDFVFSFLSITYSTALDRLDSGCFSIHVLASFNYGIDFYALLSIDYETSSLSIAQHVLECSLTDKGSRAELDLR